MKMRKKIVAGLLVTAVSVSTVAFAAPILRNIQVNYDVGLKVNGSDYTITDQAIKPFKTVDGRSYIALASLNDMGIATATYANNVVSIQSKGGDTSALQNQILALSQQTSILQAEVNKLTAENTALKNQSNTGSGSGSNTSTDAFSKLSTSERRTLARDIESEIRYWRADTIFARSQRFDGSVSVNSKDVTITLTPYGGVDFSSDERSSWNSIVASSSKLGDLEDDYTYFLEDVVDELSSLLSKYGGYNVYLNIYGDADATKSIVEGEYSGSKDRYYVDVFRLA